MPSPPAQNGTHPGPSSAEDLLQRCNLLWSELEAFRAHLKTLKQGSAIELSHYRGVVKSELKNLERLAQKARESDDTTYTSVASSNLPFLEFVWNTAKETTGIVALQKRFYFGDVIEDRRMNGHRPRGRRSSRHVTVRKGKALVDVVTRDGLEWIKVSLVTNHRMLMDKAREGWGGDSSSEEDEDEDGSSSGSDTDSGIPIVRMSEALAEAAKMVRIRTRHPLIRLVLPKIVEGEQPEIDSILGRLRTLGIKVECSDVVRNPRPLEDVLGKLLTDPFAGLTKTLNIDCTILLALVSDFSHCAVSAEPWFHRALKRQVEMEDQENLLPSTLYPAVCGHKLVCTQEAAKRMREIVDTIGTEGEKVRTSLLLGDHKDKGGDALRASMQEWSKFEVPENWDLPLHNLSEVTASETLPAVAAVVKESLTTINQSVFMSGWSHGCTTITSNRTVVKQMESILSDKAESEEDWPSIWLCPTARSLVGKEKGRKD